MPIPLMCVCGRRFQVRDDLAGAQVQCPCARVLTVPAPTAVAVPPPAAARRASTTPPPASLGAWLLSLGLVILVLAGGAALAVFLVGRLPPSSAPADPAPQAGADPVRADGAPRVNDSRPPPPGDPARRDPTPDRPANPLRTDALGSEERPRHGVTLSAVWEKRHSAPVRAVAFSADGLHVLSAAGSLGRRSPDAPEDDSLRVWDSRTGKQRTAATGLKDGLAAAAFSPGGRFALVCGPGKFVGERWVPAAQVGVRLWDLKEGRELSGKDEAPRFQGHRDDVACAAFAPDGRSVVAAGRDGVLVSWTFDGKELFRAKADGLVVDVKFSPRGDRFATAGNGDRSVRVWDAKTGTELKRLKGHADDVHCLAFAPDGKQIASGGGLQLGPDGWKEGAKDYDVRLWDIESEKETQRLKGHTYSVHGVAFSPDGRRLASAGADGTVRLWDPKTGKELERNNESREKALRCVAISPDGAYVLSGGDDGELHVWELPLTVQHVIDAAHRQDLDRLARAVKELPGMGDEAQQAFPALLEALKTGDGNVRQMALKLLDMLGPPGKERLPDLLALMDRKASLEARLYGLNAMLKIGPEARGVMAALVEALKDPDAPVRDRAARALIDLGPAAESAFPALAEALKGDDAGARKTALQVLDKIGPPGKERLPELKAMLDRKASLEARLYALTALGRLGPDAVGAVPALAAALQDPDGKVRLRAAAALGDLGAAASGAAPGLRALLRKGGDDVALLNAALEALGKVGFSAADDADVMLGLMGHADAGLRLKGLQTLLTLAPEKLTYARLLKSVADADAEVAKAAEEALRARAGPSAEADVDALRGALRDENKAVVVLALDLLTKAGRQAEKAARDLLPLAEDADAAMRLRAIKAIDAVAPNGKEAVQVRLNALKDKDRAIRFDAAVALAKMPGVEKDVLTRQVMPLLIEALKPESEDDLKDEGPWKDASAALARAGKPAVEPLFKALDTYRGADASKGVARLRVVLVIKELGPAANSSDNLFKLIELEKADPFLHVDASSGQSLYPVRIIAKQARAALQAK